MLPCLIFILCYVCSVLKVFYRNVRIISYNHCLGGMPCVLGSTEPTGDHIHTEGGLAGVVSLDGVLPPGLGIHVLGLAVLHPHAAHAPAIRELEIACRKNINACYL